jgi:hypothetical protein
LFIAETGNRSELDLARINLVRAQAAFATSRGSAAPLRLLEAARRLQPVDPVLSRATYLNAMLAVGFAGRLAGPGADFRDVARAAAAAPPLPGVPGAARPAARCAGCALQPRCVAGPTADPPGAHGPGRLSARAVGDALAVACVCPCLSRLGRTLWSGESGAAADPFRRLTEVTSASGTDWALGVEARCRALMNEDDADSSATEGCYRESISRLSRTLMRADLARAHLLYGEWLL